MVKNVALSAAMIKRLDHIRGRYGVSYTGAIEMMTVQPEMDLAIVAINRRFAELTALIPDMQEVWESLNLVAVHMHKLPPQQRIDQTEIVVGDIMNVVDHVVNIRQEMLSNDTK